MDGKEAGAAILLLAAAAIVSPAQTLTTLFNFDGTHGLTPATPLLQAVDGNLYGTTAGGGAGVAIANCISASGNPNGCGTVFQITTAGALTTLYSFCAQANCTDGNSPNGLLQGADGNLYGITNSGGAPSNNCVRQAGCGTVFKITPAGALTTLYSFCAQANCTDGNVPNGLLQGADGNLYGTTGLGGNGASSGTLGNGTIFKITPTGMLTTLYRFCSQTNCTDGSGPDGLVQGSDGNLYGITSGGGNSVCNGGCGTVFKITTGGVLTTLYAFADTSADGAYPEGTLVQATDENFYGTQTSFGGTVFKATPGGAVTQLAVIGGVPPYGGLVQASDGNLYGTTWAGGTSNSSCKNVDNSLCGSIYRATLGGSLTTLYNFCSQANCADGFHPFAGLLQAADGRFYGVTGSGGTFSDGTVFRLDLGLPPPSSTPAITAVQNAEGASPIIAPNTWVTLRGSNLAAPGDSRTWQSSDFVNNQMPTQLDGVSVTMNGENAYVYYISPAQINVLTPPDLAPGPVQVQAATNAGTSASFTAQAQAESPSFFIFGGGPYVAATHANGSLIGSTSLYPGESTPAQPGETIVIYANGFGPTSVSVVKGSSAQSGSLSPLPLVSIGGTPASVQFAGLISPGLFQFNVVVPLSAPTGDNAITATYNGFSTQAGAQLTVGP